MVPVGDRGSTPLFSSGPSSTEAVYAASGSWTIGSVSGTMTGWFNVFSGGTVPSGLGFSTLHSNPGLVPAGTISPPTPGLSSMGVAMSGPPSSSLALPTSLANYVGLSFAFFGFPLPTGPLISLPPGISRGSITSATVTTMPTPIPEPTSFFLLGTGLVAIGVRRFRQRR